MPLRVIIIGGGASGFFAAIKCAEAHTGAEVTVLERGPQFLSKVRISGGGRCNVTHACFNPNELITRYPRGARALLSPFQFFQASDTVAWFEARGIRLKTERDGRMFPVTDSSQTIIDCLTQSAQAAGVVLRTNSGVKTVNRIGEEFQLILDNGETLRCNRLLLATGSCRPGSGGDLAAGLGHDLIPPVPSLFTFTVTTPWVRELSGLSMEAVEVAIPGTPLRERGAVLLTHWGVSGPAILRLSAWGARILHDLNYTFSLQINWLPHFSVEQITEELNARRAQSPARLVVNTPIPPIPARLWERLVEACGGFSPSSRWADLSRAGLHGLVQQLIRTELPVTGKSLNKDEFVTCGGVRLRDVDFKTMESKIVPGLYFAGELLDIDGVTGGFNFQSAWTTGWLAGQAMAQ